MSRMSMPGSNLPQDQNQPTEETAPKPDPLERLEQTLGQVVERSNNSNLLAQLAADPDYAAVMQAKQSGRKFKVVMDEDQPQKEEPPPDYDSMTPTEVSNHLLTRVDQLAEKKMKTAMAPIMEQLRQQQQYVQTHEQRQAVSQLQVVAAKYADFNDVLPTMKQLVQTGVIGPNANAEQVYQAAVGVLGRTPKFAQTVQSERPTHSAAKPPLQQVRKQPLPPGRNGFSQALSEAVQRLDLSDQLDDDQVQS